MCLPSHLRLGAGREQGSSANGMCSVQCAAWHGARSEHNPGADVSPWSCQRFPRGCAQPRLWPSTGENAGRSRSGPLQEDARATTPGRAADDSHLLGARRTSRLSRLAGCLGCMGADIAVSWPAKACGGERACINARSARRLAVASVGQCDRIDALESEPGADHAHPGMATASGWLRSRGPITTDAIIRDHGH
jgi:hypothetical protein